MEVSARPACVDALHPGKGEQAVGLGDEMPGSVVGCRNRALVARRHELGSQMKRRMDYGTMGRRCDGLERMREHPGTVL